jgi:hypothetical protein
MDVCACLSGADGRVVGGRETLPTTTARPAGFESRPDGPPMDVVLCVLCCGGKYPGAQLHHLKKELADRKVPDRPNGERGRL